MMETLDTFQAAEFLHITPEVLRKKASKGVIPGAPDISKGWLFLKEDLIAYIRSRYITGADAAVKEEICSLSGEKVVEIGTPPSRLMEYHEALALPMNGLPKR